MMKIAAKPFVLFAVITAAGFSQEAAKPTPNTEVLELSPFEVRTDRDVGYTAASSLTGSRSDAPLRETPAAVSVLTREFLDDVGVTDYLSAVEWTTNAMPSYVSGDESRNAGYSIHFRGFTASLPTRNYFKWSMNGDGYNTERLEFARGPNGVLFGDGTTGGTPTVWTKRPQFGHDFTKVAARIDSFGGYRGTLDTNQQLNSRFALRLNLMYHQMESWRDRVFWERYGAHLAGTFKLTQRNNFRFEGEVGRFDRFTAATTFDDLASFWDGTTTYNGTTNPPSGKGISRIATTPYFLHIPGLPDLGYVDWTRSYRTLGTTVALEPSQRTDITNFPVLPSREFNLQPSDNIAETRYNNVAFYIDHRVGQDFFMELAYSQQLIQRDSPVNAAGLREYRIDVNEKLPNGQPNPKFLVPFSDQERTSGVTDGAGNDFLFTSAWRHEFDRMFAQVNVIAGITNRRSHEAEERVRRVNPSKPNITAPENIYRFRLYWDEPGAYLFGGLPQLPGYEFAWFPNTGTDQETRLRYVQVVSRAQFFDKRLNIIAGGRYDEFKRELNAFDGPRDPVTGIRTFSPTEYSSANPTSYNWGAVYFVRPWLGLSANYSETFGTPGAGPNLIDGTPPDISRSRGYDIGLKFELLNRRISGSLNYYDTQQMNLVTAGGFTNQNTNQINRIWTNLGRDDLANVTYRDSQDFKGTGYELDLTANLTPNFRLMLNWAWPSTTAIRVRPGLRGYYQTHLATWQAGANDLANPNHTQIASDIAAIETTLAAAAPGARLDNSLNYTGNVYGTYTFRDGRLKNFAIGAGANFRGKNKIGAAADDPFDYIMQDEYVVMSAHLSYRWKYKKMPVRFQLNVTNLLDNDDIIYTDVITYRPENISSNPQVTTPGEFRYLEPRKFAFTATFEF